MARTQLPDGHADLVDDADDRGLRPLPRPARYRWAEWRPPAELGQQGGSPAAGLLDSRGGLLPRRHVPSAAILRRGRVVGQPQPLDEGEPRGRAPSPRCRSRCPTRWARGCCSRTKRPRRRHGTRRPPVRRPPPHSTARPSADRRRRPSARPRRGPGGSAPRARGSAQRSRRRRPPTRGSAGAGRRPARRRRHRGHPSPIAVAAVTSRWRSNRRRISGTKERARATSSSSATVPRSGREARAAAASSRSARRWGRSSATSTWPIQAPTRAELASLSCQGSATYGGTSGCWPK